MICLNIYIRKKEGIYLIACLNSTNILYVSKAGFMNATMQYQ